ncbi:MAG TPA: hypothetical protein VI258_06325 [Rhodanobacteraceae bacterium]
MTADGWSPLHKMRASRLTRAEDDGIVVVGGQKGIGRRMHRNGISAALRGRLADDATDALLEVLDQHSLEWSERVMNLAVERFERRLAQEIADFRVALVGEIHDGRVEMFKWAFLFWVGQLAAFVGLLAFMLRGGH